LAFFGCEGEPPSKAAPTVVRQKIGGSADTASKTDKKPAAKTGARTPSAQAPAKPQKSPSGQPAAKTSDETPKKDAAAPAAKTASAGESQPKPAQQAPAAEKAPEPAPAAEVRPAAEKDRTASTTPAPAPSEPVLAVARRAPKILLDPFKPLFKEEEKAEEPEGGAQTKRKKRIPQTPLERIDLGQLRLTAIIRTPGGNKALVEEASGKGYIIAKGTWIGVHAGQVRQITSDAVIVEEEIENALGEVSLTTRELKLQKPPGE
jgi:type IV pilus assembly protein PilP